MLSLTPDLSPCTRGSPWIAQLERQGQLAAREPIRRAFLTREPLDPPRRILSIGTPGTDHLVLDSMFPDAAVRDGDLVAGTRGPAWSGWPDLVVCRHVLSPRQVDPAQMLATIWRGLPAGARIVVVDLYDADGESTRRMAARYGRVCDPRLLEALCAAFTPIQADLVDHPTGVRSLVFVGRR